MGGGLEMVKRKLVFIVFVSLLLISCDTGFEVYIVNDLPHEIVVTRYEDYNASKPNPERREIKVIAQSSMCLFAFFGPMDAELAGDPESIYRLLCDSIIEIAIPETNQILSSEQLRTRKSSAELNRERNVWEIKASSLFEESG
jgi:hypothetical protein